MSISTSGSVASGLGHAMITGVVGRGSAVLTALALVASSTVDPRRAWAAVAAAVGLFALEATLVRWRASR